MQPQPKCPGYSFSNKKFKNSTRPITTCNFRIPTSKEVKFSDSPHATKSNYMKTRSLQFVTSESKEKPEKKLEIIKAEPSKVYYCYDSIKPESTEAPIAPVIVLLSIFKERPACIMFDYPTFCNLPSKMTSNCKLLTPSQISKFSLKYSFTKKTPIYNCILKSLQFAGLARTDSKLKCNLLISALPKGNSLKYMNKFQKHNHFPGSWHLGRKDNLWKNIWKKRREFGEDYGFCPTTYLMPDDFRLFQQDREDNPKELWIFKPVASSCGRGIKILNNSSTVEKRSGYLISRYISNPHTLNGLKYDLRIYVLITSFDPLRIYVYKEGLVRFATQNYSIDAKSLKTRYVHLTNYSVNKKAANYLSNPGKNLGDSDKEKFSYKWPLAELKTAYEALGIDYEKVFENIHDLIIKTMIAVEPEIVSKTLSLTRSRGNCFELYGFDILLDSNLNPWLLEVNVAPSLSSGSILDKQIKTSLMCDVLTLVGIAPFDRASLKKEKTIRTSLNPRTKFKNYSMIMNSKELGELNDEEIRVIAENQEEMQRLGRFEKVFPLKSNFAKFERFFDVKRLNNAITWVSIDSEVDFLAPYLTRI